MPIAALVRRPLAALLLIFTLVLQGTTDVLAGTTGSISGTVLDASTAKPLAGTRVSATSPSQSAVTTTDNTGRFSFISLNPDTYAVSVPESAGYDAVAISGVTVQADQTVSVTLNQPTKLKTIGSVTARSASALVKPGTTADVYSINAVTQDKASTFGGGGTLNSAWSAISAVPGVYVAPNLNGYIGAAPALSIRGGDYDQIGYELDGVPVNRAFDQYPSGSLSSLGQQELQVYTGATPANSEAEGISGYINQVIRTGTAPASRNLTLAIGSPTFYNKVAFEAGGANPSRTFSYYLGAGAYNQAFRYVDNSNAAGLQRTWGGPLVPCPSNIGAPGGVPASEVLSCVTPAGLPYTNNAATPAFVLGPFNLFAVAAVRDRDTIANFHVGIPRKGGAKDDVQLLFDNNFIDNISYSSTNDLGGNRYLNDIGFGTPTYLDAYEWAGPRPGSILPAAYNGGGTVPYLFPASPGGRAFGAAIAPDRRDAFVNNQSIVKLQYQRNFGTSAFLRVYGYTYYSDWLQTGPQSTLQTYLGFIPSDYELESHTRGLSVQFSDQLNAQHLVSVQGSYTTASTLRDNNTEMFNGAFGPNQISPRTVVGGLVDSSNPYNGICYNQAHAPVNCYSRSGGGLNSANTGYFTLQQALAPGGVTPASGICGGGACRYLVLNDGRYATYNTVRPKFSALSLTDQWKPTDRLNVNLGLRLDRFEFDGSNTAGSAARTFYYNAWNRQFPAVQQVNIPSQIVAYDVWQPRAGFTYSFDPRTVVRASYGRYAEAPNSAFIQYDYLQQTAPISLAPFAALGVGNTPAHAIKPQISNNYDLSFEHQFRGDTSMKLTPFLRKTQDQQQRFFLDQRTAFVSGLNVGRQTSEGFELEVDKGDFSRNGFAGRASFTYTHSFLTYTRAPNGNSVIQGFNDAIAQYNGFTAAGGGAKCYTAAGNPDNACAAGSIANPYYNAPTQPLMDVNGRYETFSTLPGGVGAGGYTTFGAPYVGTLLVQYKHGPFAITPALQISGGTRYGVPESTPGVDPTSCTAGLAASPAGDPRYPYGAPGGAAYDALSCGSTLAIPNLYTGRFDNIGAFVAPAQLLLHAQVSYDVNKRLTLVGNFANIINRCFGGTRVPFAVNHACGYTATAGAGGGIVPAGNVYDPGDRIQPFLAIPYNPTFATSPFGMFFEARIKL